jgi:hypothetical protein
MLASFLKGATAVAAGLQFVGGVGLSSTATQTPSFSLTSLTGGLASAPAAGDIVVVSVSFQDATDRNIQCTTTGYTEVADLFQAQTNSFNAPIQLGAYYKVLSTAETSVAFNLGVSAASTFVCQVWRRINATPLDATTTTAVGVGALPDAPAITTVTNGAVVIAIGSSGVIAQVAPTAPTGMGNLFSAAVGGNQIAIASEVRPAAGTYDPATFGGFNGGGPSSWNFCAATIALRPA